MIISEILKKKRLGFPLAKDETNFIIKGLICRNVTDYQAAAYLTSSCIHGLNPEEILSLTFAMRDSGFKFNFRDRGLPVVDKHSTGGVGDKLSLLIVPLCMAFDVAVPMISGRGLGHTGGTVDKLESIAGFNIRPEKEQFYDLINKNKAFMACQTDDIAPADRILYHLRDVTGNVESIGLITASILSKKLVEDLDALVIDLKVGNGAFMNNIQDAKELAQSMKSVCQLAGVKYHVIFTSMEQPLGYKIGNWLEVEETIDALGGNCPDDVRRVTEELTAAMLISTGIFSEKENALAKIREIWNNGTALNNFYKMIESQNGDLDASRKKYSNVHKIEVKAETKGYISQIDTLYTGIAGIIAGAGRKQADDIIDYSAGITFHKKVGDNIEQNDVILTLQGKDRYKIMEAADFIKKCIIISEEEPKIPELILDEWVAE